VPWQGSSFFCCAGVGTPMQTNERSNLHIGAGIQSIVLDIK
jgi:hypothetical protein